MLVAVMAPAVADTAPALSQKFDDQIPGDAPAGWVKLWGDQGDDQIMVSNVQTVSGNCSLMLDRQNGTNVKMWGFGRPLPALQDGWYVTRFDFLVQGSGSDIAVGFEMRAQGGGNERMCEVALNGMNVNLSNPDWTHTMALGQIVAGSWYRLTLWTPTSNGKQTMAYATMENRPAAVWKVMGPAQSVPSAAPKGGYGFLEINTIPDKRGFELFIDDLEVEQRSGDNPPR
jgi:hypothetical protein